MEKKISEVETKSENKQAVYRFIQTRGYATKLDLANGLGLSRPTIKQALDFLEAENLIEPSSVIHNTGGRNALSYRIRPDGRFAVGIFFSSNHLTAVSVDLFGSILYKERIRLPLDLHSDRYLRQTGELTEKVIAQTPLPAERLLGAGMAVPSLISEDGERVIFGMTHDFSGVTRSYLSRYMPCRTRMYHDSFAAGYAEIWSNPDMKNAVYLNLNNSIGGCIIIDRKIYSGNNHRSGEVGHLILNPKSGKKCYCGQRGCLDTLCNAGVLDSLTGGNLEAFFDLVNKGDEKACGMWNTYLEHLALAIHNFRMLYDCEIIVGGYIGSYIDLYLNDLCRKTDAYRVFDASASEFVRPCKYKYDSTAAGSAIQVIEEYIQNI